MGDLSFKPIGEIEIGDEVIGFRSKNGSNGFANKSENYLCKARVLSVRSKYSPVVRITMSSGNIIRCTRDHVWLTSRYESSNWTYDHANERSFLARIINPTKLANPFMRDALEKKILGRTLLNPRDRIVSIEHDSDEEEVFCLTTTTGNYVVWGYASKNSSDHPESVNELCKWSSRKFRRFFRAYQKRAIILALDTQKNQMVAALWANSNWDDTKEEKGHRQQAIESLNEQHEEAIEAIELAFSNRPVEEEKKLTDDNPFFAASDRGLSKVEARVAEYQKKLPPHLRDTDSEEIDYMKGLDQE